MPQPPEIACPKCRGPLEYHATIDMIDPPIGKIDTGYCRTCATLFERIRETNTFYDSTLWPPLCRRCRQPVAFVSLLQRSDQTADVLRYACRQHADEQWTLTCGTDHWSRLG